MNLNQDEEPQKTIWSKLIAGVIGGMLLIVMVAALRGTEQLELSKYGHQDIGLVKNLGRVLFNEYLFPFEIVSILLLSALVGAIMIGKKEIKS
jgi:NADH-quinone oxidoreductase subunit J